MTRRHFIDLAGFGAPDVMRMAEDDCPNPAPGEVLIKTLAAGVNRADCLQRAGHYPPPEGDSPILGLEVSGHIVALGEQVKNWRIGDAIMALTPGGGYASHCLAPAQHCLPVPDGIDPIEAAGLMEGLLTIFSNLYLPPVSVQSGETVLIHGGSSGIGTLAIQMLKAEGCRVIITAGSAEKCATCLALGADQAINYRNADFEAVIGTAQIDVVLDMVGGDYLPKNLSLLRLDGRHVSIAALRGINAEISIREVMLKRLILTGSTLRRRSVEEKSHFVEKIFEKLWPLLQNGSIKSVIDRRFPLSEAVKAHERMQASQHIGKILLLTQV